MAGMKECCALTRSTYSGPNCFPSLQLKQTDFVINHPKELRKQAYLFSLLKLLASLAQYPILTINNRFLTFWGNARVQCLSLLLHTPSTSHPVIAPVVQSDPLHTRPSRKLQAQPILGQNATN